MSPTNHRAAALRSQGALSLLHHVQACPGCTRASAARALGMTSGSATEITARLKALELLDEADSPLTSGRGRPSPVLIPHSRGPVVSVVEVSHERWRIATVELGGQVLDQATGRHSDRQPEAVLGKLRRKVRAVHQRYGRRLRIVSVAIAATLQGSEVIQATSLNWRNVSLDPLRPAEDVLLLVGNDASLAGLAEARRGAGVGQKTVLHLTVEVGIGGVLVVDGQPLGGVSAAGGEFGHLPFGEPDLPCPCGAFGCWDLQVDGRAMARSLGQPPPEDPRTTAERILVAAATDPAARAAVDAATRALGRGAAGLVNALDPDLVTLSGLAVDLAATAPDELQESYLAGLMSFRRANPPHLIASTLGHNLAMGAAEAAFDLLLTQHGIEAWSKRADDGA